MTTTTTGVAKFIQGWFCTRVAGRLSERFATQWPLSKSGSHTPFLAKHNRSAHSYFLLRYINTAVKNGLEGEARERGRDELLNNSLQCTRSHYLWTGGEGEILGKSDKLSALAPHTQRCVYIHARDRAPLNNTFFLV